jgi:hypothetical protein
MTLKESLHIALKSMGPVFGSEPLSACERIDNRLNLAQILAALSREF